MATNAVLHAMFLLLAVCTLSTVSAQTPADVIVIGAGISGLAAARKLVAGGVKNVIVLEARQRKGGRLFTASVGGVLVDTGGAWIHGVSSGNPLSALASTLGLPTTPSSFTNTVFDEQFKVLDAGLDREEALIDRFMTWVDDQRGSKITQSTTMQQAYDMWLAAANLGLSATGQSRLRAVANANIEQEYAASLRWLSAMSFDQDSEFDGGDAMFNYGYSTLIETLGKNLSIKYGQAVTSISYGASLSVVTTSTGAKYSAPYVICTLPLGVLKSKSAPTFLPALPADKLTAISTLGVGLLNKVILRFNTSFWATKVATDWINILPATVGEWSDIFSLHRNLKLPVLIMFSAGDVAWAQEGLSDTAIVSSVTARLRSMFPNTYQEPVQTLVTRWGTDPWSAGSYSFIKAGAAEDAYTVLSRPVNNKLFFAGEATHQRYPATAHGAFMSGEREASRILALRGR